MSYDRRCYDLALEFLEDEGLTPQHQARIAHLIAQRVQDTIEDEIEDIRILLAKELEG